MRQSFSLRSKTVIDEPQINLTALIDIVFVVLIIFILIAPLLELDRVQLANAPHSDHAPALSVQETSPITLQVQKDNTIWLNKNPIKADKLKRSLIEAKQRFPKARPQLFHDKKAEFGTYQTVKNALEEAGFSEVDIVLNPS